MSALARSAATLLATLLALAAAAPAPARADAVAEGKAHFKKGSEFYREGKYQEAIGEFEAAYRIRPGGVLHYNVAQCYEKLGDLPNALRAYRDYLREVPNADDKASIEATLAGIERSLLGRGQQALVVYSEPAAAALAVDGALAGTTPVAVAARPGPHKLQLALAGYAAAERQVVLAPDHALEVSVPLEKAGAQPRPAQVAVATPPIPEAQAKPAPQPAPAAATAPEAAKPAPAPASASRPRLWTWVAAGAAGAALVSGALVGLAADGNAKKLRADTYNGGQTNQQLYNSAKNEAVAANVLYGAAGVCAAGAVALFFIEGSY